MKRHDAEAASLKLAETVEDTPDGLLEEEADDLVGAERYERTAGREAYRAGHYDRRLATTSGVCYVNSS